MYVNDPIHIHVVSRSKWILAILFFHMDSVFLAEAPLSSTSVYIALPVIIAVDVILKSQIKLTNLWTLKLCQHWIV